MLLGNREKNPQVMTRIGMGIMLILFVMGATTQSGMSTTAPARKSVG